MKLVELNKKPCGEYSADSQIRFKTTILRSSLYDYSVVYILVKKAIAFTGAGADATAR